MNKHWSQLLRNLYACDEGVSWAETQPTLEASWGACERGDWMLWLLGKTCAGEPWSDARKPIAIAAAECAELALPHAGRNRKIAEECIAAVRGWVRGEVSREEVQEKRHAAYTASAAYTAAYTASAAYTSAYTASAAYTAASERKRVLRECAAIIRKHFPAPPVLP